ncbi:MAG: winged helix-turn-helix domain-containing protein [Candidatus Hadarchaeota archaeon]
MAEKQEIKIIDRLLPVFKGGAEWRTVDSSELSAEIYRALSDPVRAKIYAILDDGPVRQIELARLVSRAIGKRYDVSAILHHLELLEKAGLISSMEFPGKQTKVKMIYRCRDVRLQTYDRPKLDLAQQLENKELPDFTRKSGDKK